MQTVEAAICQFVGLYNRGLLARSELVQSFVYEIAVRGSAAKGCDLCAALPQEVVSDVRRLLDDIRSRHYDWRPFLLGHSPNKEADARIRTELERLDQVLGEAN